MKPVLVIAAVQQELSLLTASVDVLARVTTAAHECLEARIGRLPLVICCSGAGKVNASSAVTAMMERYRPSLVVNTGCAGAFPGRRLRIGSLAVATDDVLADEGVSTPEGWKDLAFMRLPTVQRGKRHYHNAIPLSKHAAEKAMQLADALGITLARGRFVTVSTCSGTLARGAELEKGFRAICETMEGAAVAQVCLKYGIDCLQLRGVSNMVTDRDMSGWDIGKAVEAAQRFVLKYLEKLERELDA